MNLPAAEEALAKSCRIAQRLFAHSFDHGSNLGDRAGGALVFQDHRPYFAGDDIRRIDWRAYGRTDQLVLKTYQEEISPYLELLVDTSASLAITSVKQQALLRWTWFLATVGLHSGYTVTVQRLGLDPVPMRLEELDQSPWRFTPAPSPAESLRCSWKGRHKSVRILISDFLFDLHDAERLLSAAVRDALALHGVQLLDHDELDPPWRGAWRLVDDDHNAIEPLHISEREAAQYKQRLAAHQEALRRAFRRRGGTLAVIDAMTPTTDAVLRSLVPAGILTFA